MAKDSSSTDGTWLALGVTGLIVAAVTARGSKNEDKPPPDRPPTLASGRGPDVPHPADVPVGAFLLVRTVHDSTQSYETNCEYYPDPEDRDWCEWQTGSEAWALEPENVKEWWLMGPYRRE